MKSILVTGAFGYIGSHVVRALAQEAGVTLYALDTQIDNDCKLSNVNYIVGSFADANSWLHSLPCVPDVCLHLAWRNGFSHNHPSHMIDLSSHFAFLKLLMDEGVPHIAVMGSMHEVGYWEGPITDGTPCAPQSLYGVAKNSLREAFLLLANEMNVKAQWLRGFYITGDDFGSQSVFGKLLRADAAGRETFPFTSGKNKYDFLDVKELAKQIVASILQDDVLGIINCCSGTPMSLGERMERFIADNHLRISLEYGAYPDRLYDSPGVWGDNTKILQIMDKANR